MNGIFKILAAGAFALAMLALGVPALQAQDTDKAALAAQMQKAMAGEAPLTEKDIKTYMDNLGAILNLNSDPSTAPEVISRLGWTENRFTYVSTKMSVGMTEIMQPGSPKLAGVPAFAKPSQSELELISKYKDELIKAMEALQPKQ